MTRELLERWYARMHELAALTDGRTAQQREIAAVLHMRAIEREREETALRVALRAGMLQ